MISDVSAFLSQVYHLNNSKDHRIASQKGDKTARSNEFEIQDIVEISSGKNGAVSNRQTIQIEDAQKDDILQKPDIKTRAADHLTEQDQKVVEELQKRDREVRQHEQAHLAAAGRYAKGVSFKTQIGPDGRAYAMGGEVSIDLSEVPGDPDATIAKAQAIRRAASAPAHPSSQDRLVAAAATRMEAKARMEKTQEEKEADESEGIVTKGISKEIETDKKDEASKESVKDTNQTSGQAGSAYSLRGFETGRLLNRIV